MGAAGGGMESRYRIGSLESGALLCQAYKAHLELHAPVSISFDPVASWRLMTAAR
jgi:hypothetical protein